MLLNYYREKENFPSAGCQQTNKYSPMCLRVDLNYLCQRFLHENKKRSGNCK